MQISTVRTWRVPALRSSSLHRETAPSEVGPNLGQVNFRGADLRGVKFMKPKNVVTSWLDVLEACFEGAQLDGADISVIDLQKADGLTADQIKSAAAYPPLPANFQKRDCKAYAKLCTNTPKR